MVDWVGDDQTVKTYQGSGNGSFAADRSYFMLPGSEGFLEMTVVDINGDGYPDTAATGWLSYVTAFT